ncbi:LacI family DNA-binding transcriptional regulator [Spirochaeta cellobiosiphila]|uniref:LacI family DNA-binding transcriptional regulator n=1 Tax=Spirochaeta cellobiosiphila TaxID=504483 RepID=UPI0004244BE8|nr:LacI family DNA-binding transcriptional regulator [Spirochaeta cellobiosiphila]
MITKVDRDAVAKRAGVSSATVSRVYNNPSRVSLDKRQAVLKAAKELGYEPNKFASALARKGTGRILFVDGRKLYTYDKQNSDYYSSLYSHVLTTVNQVLQNSLYTLTLADNLDQIHQLRDYEGILLYDIDTPYQLNGYMDKPYCAGHHLQDFDGSNLFCTDNYKGGYLVGQALNIKGYKKVFYATGRLKELSPHRQRLAGLQDSYKGTLIIDEGMIGYQGGRQRAQELCTQLKADKIEAIAAVNDLTAMGFYQELLIQGYTIPTDIGLIGYDNLPFTNLFPTTLTSIDIGLEQVYKEASLHLIKQLRGETEILNTPQLIEPQIIWGGTLG